MCLRLRRCRKHAGKSVRTDSPHTSVQHLTPGGHASFRLIWGDIPLQSNGGQQMLSEGKCFIAPLHLEL